MKKQAGPGSEQAHGNRSIYFALVANLAVAVAKMVGWGLTGSGTLLAEGLHSIADTGNQGLLLLGLRQAKTPPSAAYPLGHGRAIYFWSFVVAMMLFSMGGLLSIYEGVHRLLQPAEMTSPGVAITILAFALLAEAVSLRAAVREINKVRGQRSLWTWFRETRRSALILVAAEDSAALAGLVIAFIAIVATVATGNPLFDAVGSIAIGLLLVVVALTVGGQIKGLLVGKSASPRVREAIAQFVGNRQEIRRVQTLITLQYGDDVMVAIKAQMRAAAAPRAMLIDIKRCKAELTTAFPQVAWVFFEPALNDDVASSQECRAIDA